MGNKLRKIRIFSPYRPAHAAIVGLWVALGFTTAWEFVQRFMIR